MIDSERYKLLHGPYVPPRCRVGDKLLCEHKGREVVVGGMTDAPIQWPYARATGTPGPILCGDLIRAVQSEAVIAVMHHWGVSQVTVTRWRRALEVPVYNEGSRRLRREYAVETLTPEVRERAKAAMHSPEVKAKLSRLKAGKPPHPNSVAGLLRAARRPKSEAWKRQLSRRMKEAWEDPEEHGWRPRHEWTDEEVAALGSDTDAEVAHRLDMPEDRVGKMRRRLGIPAFVRRWSDEETALLGAATDREVALRLGRTPGSVRQKRESRGIPPSHADGPHED